MQYYEKSFDVSHIKWEHVIEKISVDYSNNSARLIHAHNKSPTILCESDFLPKELDSIRESVGCSEKIYDYDLYTSFSRDSVTHGRHKDDIDVVIVQLIGEVSYIFDTGEEFFLNPGDSIFIPKGEYHDPLVWSPRSTLSFAVI